jgi:hypothetical protein
MSLPVDEFLRRFLLHLLPRGFMRIRNFGFLANRHRATLLPLCCHLLASAGLPAQTEAAQTSTHTRVTPLGNCNFIAFQNVLPLPQCDIRVLQVWGVQDQTGEHGEDRTANFQRSAGQPVVGAHRSVEAHRDAKFRCLQCVQHTVLGAGHRLHQRPSGILDEQNQALAGKEPISQVNDSIACKSGAQ